MSIHKSLKQKNTLSRQRSVLSRWERVLKLQDVGRWKDGDKVTGLPKVRTKWKIRKRKKEEAAAVPGAAAPAAGAPAAGAAKGAPAGGAKGAPAAGAKGAPAAGAKPAAGAPAPAAAAAKKK